MSVEPTIPKISSLDRVSVIHKDLRLQTSVCHSIKSLALRVQLSHFKECTICAMTYAFSPEKSYFITTIMNPGYFVVERSRLSQMGSDCSKLAMIKSFKSKC